MADWLVYGLSAMFLIGMLGCLVVIPITAFRLFAILFQHDPEEDQNPYGLEPDPSVLNQQQRCNRNNQPQ